LQITNAADVSKDTGTYLLYAGPGVGKTSTLKYLDGNALVIDIDHTSHVLRGESHIDIFKFNSHEAWTKWADLMKELAKMDLSKYDTLVFDNISELTHSMLGHMGREGKNNRVPTMMNYQQIDFMIIDSVRFLKGLGKRLVFFAWEDTDEWQTQGGQVFNRSYPMVRDKIRPNLMGLCDVVAKLAISSKTGKRGFILSPSDEVMAKNQLDSRTFSLQEDIFKVGNATKESEDDVPTS